MLGLYCKSLIIIMSNRFNLLQLNDILDLSKFKAFADKLKVIQTIKIVLRQVENIVAKGEYLGSQHHLLFLLSFQISLLF